MVAMMVVHGSGGGSHTSSFAQRRGAAREGGGGDGGGSSGAQMPCREQLAPRRGVGGKVVAAAVGHCAGTDDLFMISISVGLVGAGERDKHDDAMGGTSLTPLLNLIADPVVQPRAGRRTGSEFSVKLLAPTCCAVLCMQCMQLQVMM